MHVGGLQLFSLPEGAGPEWVLGLYDELVARTEIRPLFRRRPVRSLWSLGAWSWVDDDDVDLEHHVRHSALPRPGRVRELLALTSRLHATPLDRQRPLWEVHVIEGLEGGRFALYSKVHHALLDGTSALRLLGHTLTTSPTATVPAFWDPPASPRAGAGRGAGPFLKEIATAVGELVEAGPSAGLRMVEAALAHARTPPRTMLNVPITGSRRYAAQSWSLDEIKTVGKAFGATVNDVILAMCAGALREYLASFGALPEQPLVAMTPVSLRGEGSGTDTGNAVGAILANLATDVEDPVERLEAIKASMAEGKAALAGLTQVQATVLSAVLIAPLAANALGLVNRFMVPPFNVVISNVPGPTAPLYLGQARLEGLYPLSIPLAGQALNITATSYLGSLDFGLTGDRRALPHLQRLLGHLQAALAELQAAAGEG